MSESTHVSPVARGPAAARERSLAPDLARGLMLLLIALANSAIYIYGRPYGPRQHVSDGTAVDHAWTLVQMLLVDGRAYPMFAALFGYGMVQLLDRQVTSGGSLTGVQSLLRRRSAWLLAFGFGHALLLFPGDILATYGLCGFIIVTLLRQPDRLLLRIAAAMTPAIGLLGAVMALELPDSMKRAVVPSLAAPGYLDATGARLADWLGIVIAQVFLVLTPMLLGVWAARRRLLDEPAKHVALLQKVALAGLGAAILGGLPLALAAAQMWTSPSPAYSLLFGALHTLGGTLGGLGYAAAIGLIAARVAGRGGRVVDALAALGQRSLTFYLVQSLVFVVVFTPYGFGVGGVLGPAAVAAVAAVVWIGTVLLADLLRRLGRRGPAEVLLRRLTYGTYGIYGRGPGGQQAAER